MHSRSQMIRQHFEALAVGAKMVIIKGRRPVRIRAQTLGDPGNGLNGRGTSIALGRSRKGIG